MHELLIRKEDRLLIIAPHPDDESIGTGGLLALYANQSDVWLLTDGCIGGEEEADSISQRRKSEFINAVEYLHVSDYRMFGLRDGSLSGRISLLEKEPLLEYTKIFVPSEKDRHPDHMSAYQMVIQALEFQRIKDIEVYQYEIAAPLSYYSHVLDITGVMQQKQEAISKHGSQTKQMDYVTLATSLNAYRACSIGYRNSYLEVYCRASFNNGTNNDLLIAQKYQKFKNFFIAYDIWIKHLLNGDTLEKLLKERGLYVVAIYGFGRIGKRIFQALENTEIKIPYVIDKRIDPREVHEVSIVRPINDLEEVDGIIVSAFYDYDDIYYELHDVLNFTTVISFFELINTEKW